MSSQQMREEFEAAVKRDWPQANLQRRDSESIVRPGQYIDYNVQHAWWGWQASRAALEIELPASAEIIINGHVCDQIPDLVTRSRVVVAIEAAGVKVKL